ncbi:hypothetical protein Dfer_0876 [Dyadobacter fermentans DSM 18053]|uniref:Uncharacterized protein n=1 Tax=Dyadobacter fermentans (strain ATCC 700827 / DSM 18053 / CIP 107007 / KCTC 52180 / NS114) TaxID=471854 RepID=C6W327_DYAFD|nr:hypothetical protein Dfer_0876 [Dyadobacter fermentans DSM 18053]
MRFEFCANVKVEMHNIAITGIDTLNGHLLIISFLYFEMKGSAGMQREQCMAHCGKSGYETINP